MLSIAGKKVCKVAFGNILGLSAKRMRRVTGLLVEGKMIIVGTQKHACVNTYNVPSYYMYKSNSFVPLNRWHNISLSPLKRIKARSTKYTTAYAWMDRFFNRIGDKMPHQQKIHLPHFMSRKMVYDLLVQDIMGQGFSRQDIISGSHFYALWRDKFQFCTIPKVRLFLLKTV